MPLSKLKPLSTLPKSDQLLRVDAIGNIQRNPSSATNHLINILISPILGNQYRNGNIFDRRSVIDSQQLCYQFSVGEFFMLHPGCVLRAGGVVWRASESNFGAALNISEATTRFIKADHRVCNGSNTEYLVPPSAYKLGIALGSQFIAIERDGDPYSVLIPTMEIARFYYSGSSKLNRTLFSANITDLNSLVNINETSFDNEKRMLNITLRQDYPSEDAIILGRWFCNSDAYRQAQKIWSALIQFQHNKDLQYLPLKIGFPFTGSTHLKACGLELPTPPEFQNKRFLALSLLNCSHKFPFDKICCYRDNLGESNSEFGDNQAERKEVGYRKKIIHNVANTDGKNDPFCLPSAHLKPQFIHVNTQRFVPIHIELKKKERFTYKSARIGPPQEINLINQSTSESTYGHTNAAPISIVPTGKKRDRDAGEKVLKPECISAGFAPFQKVCEALIEYRMVDSIEDIIINSADETLNESVSHFPLYSGGAYLQWSAVYDRDVGRRGRQALLKKVTAGLYTFYLLEIERVEEFSMDGIARDDHQFAIYIFFNAQCSTVSRYVLETLFVHLAESRFKLYKRLFNLLDLQVVTRKHTGDTFQRARGIKLNFDRLRPARKHF